MMRTVINDSLKDDTKSSVSLSNKYRLPHRVWVQSAKETNTLTFADTLLPAAAAIVAHKVGSDGRMGCEVANQSQDGGRDSVGHRRAR